MEELNPTQEEIKKVTAYLAEKEKENGMFLADTDINSIMDYLDKCAKLATALSISISANKISKDLPALMTSLSIREKELIKIRKKHLGI